MKTYEKILEESLKLFAEKGYDAVSVAEIAEAVGIKAPSLYKHFKSKRDIFESIIKKMECADAETAEENGMPESNETCADAALTEEQILAYSKEKLAYWTTNEFACNFRKLLTLEQFKSDEARSMYSAYLSAGPVQYMAEIFRPYAASDEEANLAATAFYSPMFLMYSLYDGGADINELQNRLEKHIRMFFKTAFPLDKKENEKNEV